MNVMQTEPMTFQSTAFCNSSWKDTEALVEKFKT